MKNAFTLFAAVLLMGVSAFAQDPGLPDSIIVGSGHIDIDSIGHYLPVYVPVYVVTDDSVVFYCLPLKWWASRGGISISTRTVQYFYPLEMWDEHYDTAFTAENYVLQIGWADLMADTTPDPPIVTTGQRFHAWTLRFVIAPNTPPQLVVLDTCWNARNGSLAFGLIDGLSEITPGFQRGFISWGIVGAEDAIPTPIVFSLRQNYPNPFNAATKIEFALPHPGPVRLEVFDLLGRRVAILVDGEYPAGVHAVTWNGGGAPSGVYTYRLAAGGFSENRKMVLLK
jgi:hypothetical protein